MNKRIKIFNKFIQQISLSEKQMPFFHIQIDDKVFVYGINFTTKYTLVCTCLADNCSAKCKITPNEEILVCKDPNRRIQYSEYLKLTKKTHQFD